MNLPDQVPIAVLSREAYPRLADIEREHQQMQNDMAEAKLRERPIDQYQFLRQFPLAEKGNQVHAQTRGRKG
jgi:hypothetical protein